MAKLRNLKGDVFPGQLQNCLDECWSFRNIYWMLLLTKSCVKNDSIYFFFLDTDYWLIDWFLLYLILHKKSAMVNLFLCFLDMVPIVLQHFEFPVPTVIFPVHRKCKLGELQEICGIALDFISLAWSSVQISFLCIIARQLMCPRRLIQHLYTAQLV